MKYILLLKKYYIAEAELQKRLNEGGDRKALEDQYRKDFNDGSFLWYVIFSRYDHRIYSLTPILKGRVHC